MKSLLCIGIAAVGIAAVSLSFTSKQTTFSPNQADTMFARMAYLSSNAEISAGNMAGQKAKDPKVAEYGKMMVADHTDANKQLLAIIGNPPTTDSLDAEHIALKDSLMAATGSEFDALYVHSQVKDHRKAVELFQKEATSGQDPKLKSYAAKLLPKLKMHLEHAMRFTRNNSTSSSH